MSANYNAKTGPVPATLPARQRGTQPTVQLVQAVALPAGTPPPRASLADVVRSAAGAITAANEACARECESEAAAALERTTARIAAAQANVLAMQEQLREAEIRAIEQEARRLAAIHHLRLAARTRAVTDAAALVAAQQVVVDARADARLAALSHQQREAEKQVELLDVALRKLQRTHAIQLAAAPPPPPPPPGPDPIEAEVRCVVRDAAHDLVWTDAYNLYHAYAGCHYLAARIRSVPHVQAAAETFETVLLRRREQPLSLDDARGFQRRYDALQRVIAAHRAGDRSAVAEQEKLRAQLSIEQLRRETAELQLRNTAQLARAIGENDDETTK